jgi:predicted permease
MSELLFDLRSSLRGLRHRPGPALVVVGVLALGLSAGLAVFTYINAFHQPFPGVDDRGLVRVFEADEENPYLDLPYLDYRDYAKAPGILEGLAATQPFYAASVRHETMTEVAFLEAVSGNYFSMLGAGTSLGRGFTEGDDRAGADPVAVLSHEWWQRSFGGEASVLGTTLYLNFRPFTVVGVAAPEFLGTASGFRPDVWIPFAPFQDRYTGWAARAEDREIPLVRVYGRVPSGGREDQIQATLGTVARGLDEAFPRQTRPRRLHLDRASWIDPSARVAETPTVRLMMAAAAVFLLLACANVANLLLSRTAGRRREISVRAALGASPGRLFRQVLAENVLLSVVAGLLALALAGPVSARLGSYFARPSVWGSYVPREAALDLRVVLFALGLSLATGVISSLLPALQARSRHLFEALKAEAHLAAGAPRRLRGRWAPGLSDVLVATQAGLSILLLVLAGLVLRTLVSVGRLDPGFAYDDLVVTHISTSSTTLKPEERDLFFREVARQLGEEPWVRKATVADFPLLSPHRSAELRLDGHTDPVSLVYSMVLPGFFDTLGIPVLRGRAFVPGDETGTRDVAVVNEALARRFFAGQAPVGRRLWWPGSDGAADRVYEIVGVVGDTRTQDLLAPPEPTAYFSYPQHRYPTGSALIVSVAGDPGATVPVLHRWLRDHEPHLAIVNVVPYTEVVRGLLYTHRMNAEMYSGLALLGLALAAVGIFGVVSLAVSRRTREIGVRMSLGASRGDIFGLVIRRALVPVAVGLAAGLAASLAVTRMVRSLLYGIEPHDPLTLATGTAVLLGAALLAASLPALRAAAVDPVEALRHE